VCSVPRRKCLFLYFYFMDRDFGLIQVRLQTCFPLQIQVYVNGHEWLTRRLDKKQIRYRKIRECFRVDRGFGEGTKAFRTVLLTELASTVNPRCQEGHPLFSDLLQSMSYYWVTTQREYSTDILFKSPDPFGGTLSSITEPQQVVLWGQASHELS